MSKLVVAESLMSSTEDEGQLIKTAERKQNQQVAALNFRLSD